MDFDTARLTVLAEDKDRYCGIGSLSERIIHRIIKYYIESDASYHEVKFSGSIADIKRGDEIFEIQTRNLKKLDSKISRFITAGSRVTVVHPIAAEKRIIRLNKETGEFLKPRRSPSPKTVFDCAKDLFDLRHHIGKEGFSVQLLLISVDEYKRSEKKSRYGESDIIERVPTRLIDTVTLKNKEDYTVFLPDRLPEVFTAKDYLERLPSKSRYCYYGIRLLEYLGFVNRIENKGRAYQYRRAFG